MDLKWRGLSKSLGQLVLMISTAIACKNLDGLLSSKYLQKVAKLPVA